MVIQHTDPIRKLRGLRRSARLMFAMGLAAILTQDMVFASFVLSVFLLLVAIALSEIRANLRAMSIMVPTSESPGPGKKRAP
jgi:hypothetical protein